MFFGWDPVGNMWKPSCLFGEYGISPCHFNESRGWNASGWLKRPRLMACVTWATACPRRCFHPLSRRPCPCPLVKNGWDIQDGNVGCRFARVFPTIIHRTHDSSELVVYLIGYFHHYLGKIPIWVVCFNWVVQPPTSSTSYYFTWGMIGTDFFSPKDVPETFCIRLSWSWWGVVPGSQLAVSRELELFSCFFFLCACRRHKFLSQRHRHQPSKNHQLSPSDMQTIGLYATFCPVFFFRAGDSSSLKL